MASPVEIRDERPGDAPVIREIVSVAFGRPAEADLVDALRRAGAVLASLVAEVDGELVGHVLVSPVALDGGGTAGGLAPLAVAPAHQGSGVGSALVRAALTRGRASGLPALFVLGEPRFYQRVGFTAAARSGLRSVYPDSEEAFMVVELEPGGSRAAQAWCGIDPSSTRCSRGRRVRVGRRSLTATRPSST